MCLEAHARLILISFLIAESHIRRLELSAPLVVFGIDLSLSHVTLNHPNLLYLFYSGKNILLPRLFVLSD